MPSEISEIISKFCVSREDYLALTPKINDAQMDAKMLDANLILAHQEIARCHAQMEQDKREIESLLTHARNALAYHITTKIALESRIKAQAETIQRYQSNPESMELEAYRAAREDIGIKDNGQQVFCWNHNKLEAAYAKSA